MRDSNRISLCKTKEKSEIERETKGCRVGGEKGRERVYLEWVRIKA
jgi:hypothetical protein